MIILTTGVWFAEAHSRLVHPTWQCTTRPNYWKCGRVYTYIKGQGWVVEPDVVFHERVVAGVRIRFEERIPQVGEYFFSMPAGWSAKRFLYGIGEHAFTGKYETLRTTEPDDYFKLTNYVTVAYHGPA